MRKLTSGTIAGFAGALLFALPGAAAPIGGSFTGTGWATVSFTNLNFCPNGVEPNGANQGNACGFGTGNIDLGGGSGSFAGVTGDANTIDSLNNIIAPIGGVVSIPNWLEFIPAQGAPPISLTLTSVLAGTFSAAACGDAPAPGQVCTPPGSAFNLSNSDANNSTASFRIVGQAVNGVAGDTSPFVAIFTSQFNVPYQQLLAALAANQGTGNYSSSYSVSVTATAVPEPVTFSLVGVALLSLGMVRFRSRK